MIASRRYRTKTPELSNQSSADRIFLENASLAIRCGSFPEHETARLGLVGKLWPTPGATLRRLGIEPGTTLAEVPCGNGCFTLPAARITDPGIVYALDLDEALLEELKTLADQQGIENIVPIQGDARALMEHLPEPVDTVLIANTFHGIEEKEAFVQQAFESLHSDGRVIIVNWLDLPREATTITGAQRGPPTDLRLSPTETESIVRKASDCHLVEHVELPPYHYALVFTR